MRSSLVLSSLLSFAAAAAPTQFKTEGNSVIVGSDTASAVTRAARVGELDALSQALKKMGGSPDDAETLLDQHRAEILKSSDITGQTTDGSILTVKLSLSIDLDALARSAGITPGKARAAKANDTGKRVLILATEQLGPNQIIAWTDFAFAVAPGSVSGNSKTHLLQLIDESGSLEAALAAAFTDAGFDVIDPKVLRGKLSKPALQAVDLTSAQAEDIAKKSDADIVVIAKGKANPQFHAALAESGMHSGNGNVVLRAIRVRDGKVLSASTQQGAMVHLDQETAQLLALNEAAKLASEDVLRKLKSE